MADATVDAANADRPAGALPAGSAPAGVRETGTDPSQRRTVHAVLAAAGTAVVLATAFLAAPPMGTDLAAQVARARFASRQGAVPIDLSWYGGVNQFGYSLFAGALGALVGVRVLGAVSAVIWAAAFGYLLARSGARRPVAGAVAGAVLAIGNLVSGRTTFALGTALGLLALCAIVAPRPGRAARLVLAGVLAALATWASPVSGLFTGLAGGAVLLAGLRPRPGLRQGPGPGLRQGPGPGLRQGPGPGLGQGPGPGLRRWFPAGVPAAGLVLTVVPLVALAPVTLAGDGGAQPFTAKSMLISLVACVVVFLAVPARFRTVRIGAALTAVLLLGAFVVPTPIGSNALRLPMLFAVPVVVALTPLSLPWLAALVAALVWWQPPVVTSDLGRAGSVQSRAGYFRPLLAELSRRAPVGRVEVVPLRDHWESAYVAPAVPLARGWLRQVDTDRNGLFYREPLRSVDYGQWLRDNAVSYVALAPGAIPDRYARPEAALVAAGQPYLHEVWHDATWHLYAVSAPQPLVSAPAILVGSSAGRVVLTVPAAGTPATGPSGTMITVRVRWSRWLSVAGPAGGGTRGACLSRGPDGWTVLSTGSPGRYVLSSDIRAGLGLRSSQGCAAGGQRW